MLLFTTKADAAIIGGKLDEADRYFDEELKLDPDAWHPRYGTQAMASLAILYAMEGRWSECEFMFKESLRENPMSAAMKLSPPEIE